MRTYDVTVYSNGHKERIEVRAVNQAQLKARVQGMGYDRVGAIHGTY